MLMGTNVIIVAISSLTAIIIAALTYYTTKQREREAEWRKEKLAHYKDYFAALAETIGTDVSHEARARYCVAFNTVGLLASQDVIKRLQEITRLPYAEVSRDEHDRRLTDLVLAVRRDLESPGMMRCDWRDDYEQGWVFEKLYLFDPLRRLANPLQSHF